MSYICKVNFYEAVKKRRMRRHFVDTEISTDVVRRIVWAISKAPSAGHTQGNRILVLHSSHSRDRFWSCCESEEWPSRQPPSLRFASLIIVFFENQDAYIDRYQQQDKEGVLKRNKGQFVAPYWTIDAAFMAMIGQLSAVEEGLDYLFFGVHQDLDRLFDEFEISKKLRVIGVLAIGRSIDVASGSALRREKLSPDQISIGGKVH